MSDEPNPYTHHCPAVNEILHRQDKLVVQILMEAHLKSLSFQTTAIYPNRVEDKEKVERLTGLQEEGNENVVFPMRSGETFAVGYNRIVYGDHGPYVEFEWKHIEAILVPKCKFPPADGLYYEWLTPLNDPNIKVYKQLKTVADLPNPPHGGFRGNRKEGYADYKVGMIYVSVGDFSKIVNR